MADILVATSIAPGGRIDAQRNAVRSWLAHGLDVVSLNSPAEIARLTPDFPELTFRPVERTGKLLTGRDHVYLDDLLHHLGASGAPLVGIINSDIEIETSPTLFDRISDAARDGLVCGPRLDISDAADKTGRIDPFGYDAFFFAPSAIEHWTHTRFCLGQGFWDHWLPLMALLRGLPTYKLQTGIGRHVAHAISRDDSFFLFADEFAGLASGLMRADQNAPMDWKTFGAGFPKHAYAQLRAQAVAGLPGAAEAFASFIDDLTRYVIRFIDINALKMKAD